MPETYLTTGPVYPAVFEYGIDCRPGRAGRDGIDRIIFSER
jgi:hypothetical protein